MIGIVELNIEAAKVIVSTEINTLTNEKRLKEPEYDYSYKFLSCTDDGTPIVSKDGSEWIAALSDVIVSGKEVNSHMLILDALDYFIDQNVIMINKASAVRKKLVGSLESELHLGEQED